MPKTERDRFANPRHVWDAMDSIFHSFMDVVPKPRKGESFNAYRERLEQAGTWKESAMFLAIISLGCTTDGRPVSQREFLFGIDDAAEELYKIRQALHKMFPGR